MYIGDFLLGVTIKHLFNSNDAPGALLTLAGSPAVSVYESGNATEFTAGATIDDDYDAKTGMHEVTIDTSSGYSAGKDYTVWLSAGTVDGVSQVNMILFRFSIQNRYLGANVIQWNGTAIPGVDTAGYPKVTIKDGTGTGEIDTTSGKVAATIAAGDIANDAISGNAFSTDAADKVADHVWDESSLAHTSLNSFGALLALIKAQAEANGTAITSIQNNTRVVRVVPTVIERPDSGTTTYRIELLLYDEVGNMEAPDSAPTIALVDQGGTDLSARLDSATMTLVSTGRYRAIYTASDTDDLEQLVWAFSVVEGSNTRVYGNTTIIVDTTAVDFTSADRTVLQAAATQATALLVKAKTDLIPASPAATGDIPTAVQNRQEMDSNSTKLAAIVLDTDELQTEWADGGRSDLIIDAAAADALLARKLLESDKYVVKSGTPWQVVYMLKGSGAPGAGTELLRQDLFDVDGADLASVATPIGQTVVA